MNSSWVSRITFAITATLGVVVSNGALPPKYAVWGLVALAFFQSLQHPIQQSTSDYKVAKEAVQENQVKE